MELGEYSLPLKRRVALRLWAEAQRPDESRRYGKGKAVVDAGQLYMQYILAKRRSVFEVESSGFAGGSIAHVRVKQSWSETLKMGFAMA